MWPLWPVLGQPFPVLQSLGPPLSQARLQPADTARPGADAAPSPREGGKQLGGRGGEAAADLLRVNPSSVSLLTSSFGSSTGRECCQDPSPGHPSQPAPHPTLEKPEARIWGGRPASLPRGGVWLSPAEPPGPGSGPPPLLAGSLLLAVCSRSGAEGAPLKPPPLPVPLQALHKSSPTPPHSPQPTSRSPRGTLPVPFMFPLRGTSPSTAADSCSSAGPSSMAVVRPAGPPSKGAEGALQGGKDSFATFPGS